ncbi:hypothetical protein HHI36_007462 [Cryptolaemus montrouzieri]|uniref:Uncharacterized protein n=1 Tax=Cryptolaemus montrouzieri TaxID=559131 RepID=A0ABD2MQG5_9CUCU
MQIDLDHINIDFEILVILNFSVIQMGPGNIKQIIRSGDIEKLENIVLEGHGKKLLNEHSSDYKTRMFLKSVPNLMTQIGLLHDAVNSGRLEELQSILNDNKDKKKKLVLAKDENGVGLLHKAVYYDLKDIYKYLIEKFPNTASQKDMEGRTPYHYTALCKDPALVQRMLLNAGADFSILDVRQHSGKYYMNHTEELELPSAQSSASSTRRSTSNREGLNFKKSNIRIWIHQRNLGNLQQVVWEGNGSKLLPEHSNNAKIKKFLEAVPHIMGLVKEIHTDVINGDLESLKSRTRGGTIPPIVLYGKDSNGLTPLHKAAGLGRTEIAEYLIGQYPKSLDAVDNEARTPLHYSSLLKDNGKMADFLIENGADESALDSKQKTAAYYRNRASELDSKLLHVIPDCPRTSKGETYLSKWDWGLLASSASIEEIPKVIKKVKDVENNNKNNNDEIKENGNGNHETTEVDNGEDSDLKNGENTTNGHSEEESKDNDGNNNDAPLGSAVRPDEEIEEEPGEQPNDSTENNNDKENGEEQMEHEEEGNNADQEQEDGLNAENDDHENGDVENHNDHEQENEGGKQEDETEIMENEEEIPKNRSRPSSTATTKPMTGTPEEVNGTDSKKNSAKSSKDEDAEAEGVIEGVVDGENEAEVLNQDGSGSNQADKVDVDALIQSGNMEKLASLVLNGRGDLLVGRSSENPELQAFLENVPVYMDKINRIHVAARNGSLRDLQAALDRRKFAIAKDTISPDGASPLHVAIIFGNTSIVRYLAGRFPETLQQTDVNERIPLHYAATIADNSHYYNLLIHLGSDMRAQDKFGHNPDYYRSNHSEMSHRSLLENFGETELADEMLKDKGM